MKHVNDLNPPATFKSIKNKHEINVLYKLIYPKQLSYTYMSLCIINIKIVMRHVKFVCISVHVRIPSL